ncbi:polysaccharide deacetylase family protein [Paenibacillus sp. GCM10027629]|uniref:polysaccharide deacetylase family protein n=1 Tax=Paenibacillus sp. GCM10027629 TaxID=3273414 RepID=UPI003636A093
MMRKKLFMIISSFIIFLLLAEWTGYRETIAVWRGTQPTTNAFEWFKTDASDVLMKRILQEADQRRVPPIEPRIDRVWKLIPGYNGIEVDVEKTYQLNHASAEGDPIKFVYKELTPTKSLDDLPANPMYRGNPEKPMVSLMINVAWGDEFIGPMLDTLDTEQVKATFFFDGKWLDSHVDMAKEIQRRGHQLENHAYSHKDMSKLNEYEATQEIAKTQKLLKEKLGVENKWFAPPSGDFDAETVRIAHSLNLKTVLWTLDTVDWKKPTPSSVVEKISRKVEAGSLILMHPTASSSGALKGMIRVIKQRGYTLGTIDEMVSTTRVKKAKVEGR